MEEPNTPIIDNQSDSDSSESWTFVDKSLPKIETQNQEVSSTLDGNSLERNVKETDDDTDGVAVITDDEEAVPSQTTHVAEPPPPYQSNPSISMSPGSCKKSLDPETNSCCLLRESEEELPTDFFMADPKIKSYVHKRNNHLSNLLNLILIGALIIATTLAVGFTWGINDTCSVDVLDSVNGLILNLQKLQRENDMLKSKIRILRAMKHNAPVENDINFDKFLDYQMQKEQENILPKFAKGLNVVSSIEIDLDAENPEIMKEAINIEDSNMQINDTNPFIADIIQDNIYKNNQWINKQKYNINIPNRVTDNLQGKIKEEVQAKVRERRDASKQWDLKSYCENTASLADKEYKRKCSYFLKQYEAKRDNNMEKSKVKSDKSGEDKYSNEDLSKNHKAKKVSIEKSMKDKPKSKDMKREKKFSQYQESHSHYNDNIKMDWYQKMYDGRKQMRENGLGDYNLLNNQNKAKWYFKRMNDREKNRWKGVDKLYKRQMRREFFKSKL